jgi:hypothetical protein
VHPYAALAYATCVEGLSPVHIDASGWISTRSTPSNARQDEQMTEIPRGRSATRPGQIGTPRRSATPRGDRDLRGPGRGRSGLTGGTSGLRPGELGNSPAAGRQLARGRSGLPGGPRDSARQVGDSPAASLRVTRGVLETPRWGLGDPHAGRERAPTATPAWPAAAARRMAPPRRSGARPWRQRPRAARASRAIPRPRSRHHLAAG